MSETAMLEVGERLATGGYFVLLPDLFYRSGPYAPMDAKTVFSDPGQRKVLTEKFLCMGGLMSLTAAGTYPECIAATASYHAGRLATDAPDSPHRLAPKIRSRVYIVGAIEDAGFPDEMKARLEQALTEAGVDHIIETYPARHGFVLRDTLTDDPAAAERHWRTLTSLLDSTVRTRA